MVHSCLLANLRLEESDLLAYSPSKVSVTIKNALLFPASPQLLSITNPPNAGERVSRPSGRHDRVCFVCNSQQQPNICRQHPLLWGEHDNSFAILVVMFQVIMLPLEEGQALSADLPNLQNTLLEATVKGPIIQVHVGQGQVLDSTWVGNLAITLKRLLWPKDDE